MLGPDTRKHLRNAAIVLALAAVVDLVPGGREGGATVSNLLGVILAAGFAFLGYRLYMEHRVTLMDLDERLRRILYAALAVAVFCVLAADRMLNGSGASAFAWLALCVLAAYGVFHVVARWRAY